MQNSIKWIFALSLMHHPHVPAVVGKNSRSPMKNRTLPFFPTPSAPRARAKRSSFVHFVSYALAPSWSFPSCCGSPCRSLHKFRSLAWTPSQPRTRAAQPKKGCTALALPLPKGRYTIEVCLAIAIALAHKSNGEPPSNAF